jgi:myo-inositol-1(or 4)-monophosphatase
MGLEYQLSKSKEAVVEAGKIILDRYQRRDFGIEYKGDGSPATKADKEAEEKIRSVILGAFPTNSFTGEEFDPVNGSDNSRWYCDPIDGTWCIINGEKTASTSLALSENGKTVLAVVYNPFTNELFSGADGIQTTLNDDEIPRFNRNVPIEAVYNFQISAKRKNDVLELYNLWEQKSIAKLISRGGSIAYNLAQIAEGSHSVYIAASTKPSDEWDVAGGIYLVKSVGGEVSQMDEGRILIASTNPEIHKKTLDLLVQTNFGKRD